MEDAQTIWAARSDDELLEASSELFDFTEEGERIIRAELQRRGLAAPDPPIGNCSRCGRSIAANHPGDRCSECEEPFPPEILRRLEGRSPEPELVLVLRTEDPGLVPFAKSMLDKEGIEHLVRGADLQDPFEGGGGGSGYRHGPVEFWVRDEDAERARILLDGLGKLRTEARREE
jgi:Putative prokaryotic signal transducing protein